MEHAGQCRFAGNCVCVYDQNYALVMVNQPRKEECAIRLDKKTQFSFLI